MTAILKVQLLSLFHFSVAARISIKDKSIKSPTMTALQLWGRAMIVVILGGTMLTDEGSSRSQAEVHERGLNDLAMEDLEFVIHAIYKLFSLLENKGVLPANTPVKPILPETLTVDDKLKIDEFLKKNFNVDKSHYERRYDVEILEEKENESNVNQTSTKEDI